jgi:DNA polymerase-1
LKEGIEVVLNPKHIDLEPIIGLDLETSGLQAWEEKVKLIIIATTKHLYILDVRLYSDTYLRELFTAIRDCQTVVAHNGKFDCGFIYYHYGVLLQNWWCTQIASQILTNGKLEFQGKHTLPEVLERYLHVKLEFSAKNKKLLQKSFTSQFALDRFSEKQLRYASDDVKFLIDLFVKQSRLVDNLQLKAIAKLENDLLPILAKMEIEGVLVDQDNWRTLIKTHWIPDVHEIEQRLDKEVELLTKRQINRRKATVTEFNLFGEPTITVVSSEEAINYASAAQVIQFFRDLGQEVPKVAVKKKKITIVNGERDVVTSHEYFTDLFGDSYYELPEDQEEEIEWKESIDEIALTTYINERPTSILKPFIKELIDYRVANKRVSTYGEKFLAQLDIFSKIHTGYTQTFTATGRLSSKSPNLQNIPAPQKGKPHTDIRRFFIARPGYKLITCDMAGAEVAIAADYSQEPLLLSALREGADMHSDLASISYSIIFGQPVKVSKSNEPLSIGDHTFIPQELRDHHKSVVFAKFYKAGAKRIYSVLAEYINLFHTEDKRLEIASEISTALDKRMPKLSKYLDGLIKKAQTDGFLRTSKMGRIRFFNEDVYGEAANAPIQGSNAEAIKMAMVEAFKYFSNCGFDGRIAMNIHDELVCEVKDEYCEVAAPVIKKIMADSLSFFLTTIEGGASVEIYKHWKK